MIPAYLIEKLGPVFGRLAGYGVVLVAIVAALWFAYLWAYNRGVASQASIVALAQEREHAATTVNAQNNEQIDSLTNRLNECTASITASVQQAQEAARDLHDTQTKAAEAAQGKKDERTRTIAAQPATQAWADERVPDDLVDALRVQ